MTNTKLEEQTVKADRVDIQIHHLFDRKQPLLAKLWLGNSVTYKHPHDDNNVVASDSSGKGQAGAGSAYASETNLTASEASEAKELMFALEIVCGYVEVSAPSIPAAISVNVAGCKGAVIGDMSSPNCYSASDYAIDLNGIPGGSLQEVAMDQVMRGIIPNIMPPLVLNVSKQQHTISPSDDPSGGTSTITISDVGTFTTQKRHEPHHNNKECS